MDGGGGALWHHIGLGLTPCFAIFWIYILLCGGLGWESQTLHGFHIKVNEMEAVTL